MTGSEPSDEEVAAVVVALLGLAAAGPDEDETPSLWRDRTLLLGAPLLAGRDSWRASALPR